MGPNISIQFNSIQITFIDNKNNVCDGVNIVRQRKTRSFDDTNGLPQKHEAKNKDWLESFKQLQ